MLQVNGIKGASVFLLFKPFDLVKGFVIDWMHSVCLGVTKSLINLWLNAENRKEEFFLASKVHFMYMFVFYLTNQPFSHGLLSYRP